MNLQILSACTNILWDWNGTLLNDLDICLESINRLLHKRGLPRLDHARYLDIFTFPVINYYTTAGFDFGKESFETVAAEFMGHYLNLVSDAPLHTGADGILQWFQHTGRKQAILSAMEAGELTRLVNHHGINRYFSAVYGMQDHLAHGKLSLAHFAMEETGFSREHTCLIGDTLHDAEVADQLGIWCLLVADGHQSETRLKSTGYPVINKLSGIPGIFS